MNVRFKKTNKGEVAILPRKEYEILVVKAQEADEDFGTARLVVRARKEISVVCYSSQNKTESPAERTRYARSANGAVKRSLTSRIRLRLDKVTFLTWKADGEKDQLRL